MSEQALLPTGAAPDPGGAPASGEAAAAASPAKPGARKVCFIHPVVDFLLAGGASIVVFVLLRNFHSGVRSEAVYTLSAQLMWVCNWPHFAATSFRLYHSKENIRQYPLTALVIPWVVTAGVLGAMASPLHFAPFFVMIYLLWSPYHFSGQTVGVAMIYARRSGFKVGPVERFFLSSFVFGTFICTTIHGHTSTLGSDYFGIRGPGLGLPLWLWRFSEFWVYIAGFMFLVLMLHGCLRNRRFPPLMMLLPPVAQFIWFMPVAGANWPSFAEFVPFFHSLQYMLIAWSMQLKEKMDMEGIEPSPWYVLGESARWGLINFVVGALLFFGIPHGLSQAFGIPIMLSMGVFTAGVQIHHFFVDGVIWKLKSTRVSSPLMMNVEDLIHGREEPAPALAAAERRA
ncbi:MAG: hypothetical protein KIS92_17600 [Planctomycetota bacterium]|nr:hypothetical protein [Planctomycetota bacterium]